MRVVIHIGPHKTGSSFLQAHFVALADALSRAGILYPDQGWMLLQSHGRLCLIEPPSQLSAELASFVDREAQRARAILLSAEDLASMPRAKVEAVRAAIQHPVTVVAFIRDPVARLRSFWNQETYKGSTRDWNAFAAAHLAQPGNSDVLNPAIQIGRWAEVFGESSIRLISFEPAAAAVHGDLMTEFFRAAFGVRLAPIAPAHRRVNASLSLAETEILRALNRIDQRHRTPPPDDLYDRYYIWRAANNDHKALIRALQDRQRSQLVDCESVYEPHLNFLESNAHLFTNEIARTQTESLEVIEAGWEDDPDLADALERLYSSIMG